MRFSMLHQTKDEIIESVLSFLKRLERQAKKRIKALRQDNVGENKAMEKEMIKQEFECNFE